MKYLIDTHTLLWAITDEAQLPQNIFDILSKPDENDIFVSTVSFWEIAIKTSIGKLTLDNFDMSKLIEYCEGLGFAIIALEPEDSLFYAKIPIKPSHKDPFDRMLITTAINNGFTLISKDENIPLYTADGLSFLWK